MARTLEIRHGSGTVRLAVPSGARLPIIEHGIRQDLAAEKDLAAGLRRALAPLKGVQGAGGEFAKAAAGRHLALLVDDATRSEPHAAAVQACLELCAAVKPAKVTAFVCTGTHEPALPENVALAAELRSAIAASAFPSAELVVHDCRGAMAERGRTSRGTRVLVNAQSEQADVFLAISDMKNHYFAGYSNPVKGLVPGISGFETARGNHALALDPRSTFGFHPWHPDPARRENPLPDIPEK